MEFGSKVVVADTLKDLKNNVAQDSVSTLKGIESEEFTWRFLHFVY